MLSGDRRGVSARRGMTVLGKIPAVPKPINLPSQRLENRGLDPNVEIVPRGSVSWGSAGRSPPLSGNVWGNSQQSSSPPVSSAPWGTSTKNSGGLVGSASRPSSAGSGTRPSTADSGRKIQEVANTANAWNLSTSRPSSASGVLGQSHSQPSSNRPRSAETRPADLQRSLAQYPESYTGTPSSQAWGTSGNKIFVDELSHPARFTLSHGDFPSLGSEKTQDLRPQQPMLPWVPGNSLHSLLMRCNLVVDENGCCSGDQVTCDNHSIIRGAAAATSEVDNKEKALTDNWKNDSVLADGLSSGPDGSWRGDGPPLQSFPGQYPSPESWRKDGHGVASVHGSGDHWPRSGPPTGPYGAGVGPILPPGRFPYDSAGFMHHQRFGPGPIPPLRGGPAGYDRHGDGFRNVFSMRPTAMMPERPGPAFGPGVYTGPMPYESFGVYSGISGPGYRNMDEREMMVGMGNRPGFYGGFPHRPGPAEPFNLYRPGIGFGPHQSHNHPGMAREVVEMIGYEGESRHEGRINEVTGFRQNDDLKDGGNRVYRAHAGPAGKSDSEGNTWKRGRSVANDIGSEAQRHSFQGIPERPLHGHQDWGAAAFVDEPMDFSKPVFEDDTVFEIKKEVNQTLTGSDLSSLNTKTGYTLKKDMKGDFLEETPRSVDVSNKHSHVEAVEGITNSERNACREVVFAEKIKVHFSEQSSVNENEDLPKTKLGASQVSVTADQLVGDPPVMEDSCIDAKFTTIAKDGISQSNSSDGSTNLTSTKLYSGNMVSEASASFPSSDFTSDSGEISSFSEKDSGSLQLDSRCGPIDIDTLPVDKVFSERPNSTMEVVEKPDFQKKNKQLLHSDTGTDISPSVSDFAFTAGDQKVDTTVNAGSTHAQHPKEEFRPRVKASSHEVEKEWRPKSAKGARVERPKSLSNKPFTSNKLQTVSSSLQSTIPLSEPAHLTEKSGLDIESATSSDSYDYDAQRARMKEIAAQRAQQLQREEEERTKEQKAKALAKLEELNRRTVAAVAQCSNVFNSESSKEVQNADLVQLEMHAPVSTQIESNESIAVLRPAGHMKNEQAKGVLNSDLEPNLVTNSPILSKFPDESAELYQANETRSQPEDMHKSSEQEHINSKVPHPRYRSKPFVSLPKHTSRQPNSAKDMELEKADYVTGVSDQRIDDKPMLTLSSPDDITVEGSGKKLLAGQLGQPMPFRKKKSSRNPKSRPKADFEDNSMSYEATAESNDLPDEVMKGDDNPSAGMVAVKNTVVPSSSVMNTKVNESILSEEISTTVWKDISQGHEEQSKGTGEVQVKRISQKHQQAKRPLRDRVSQDIRADKHSIGEGMIWAPVRSNANNNGGGLRLNDDVVADTSSVGMDEEMNNQQLTKAKRAELERYTPKAVMKQHAQNQHASEPVLSTGEMSSIQHENEIMPQSSLSSMPRASAEHNQRQMPYPNNQQTNYRSEGRQHEFANKSGRFQASWRQRGSVAEQATNDVKEALVHSTDDSHAPLRLERETRGRVFESRHQEQRSQSKQQRSRHVGVDWGSEQTYFRKPGKFQQEARPSSPQTNHQYHAVPIHENDHQAVAITEEITEVAVHSSISLSTGRHHGNPEKFQHIAKNIVKPLGHAVSGNIEVVNEATPNPKLGRDQQKPDKPAAFSPRSRGPLINQGHDFEESHGREHQNKFSHAPSRTVPFQASKARRSFSQGNESEIVHPHSSSQNYNAVVSSANVQDALPRLSERASEKVPSALQFGASAPQHAKGGSSFDTHGREKNTFRISQEHSKHPQTNRQQGFYAAFDREQRDGSNTYRQRSGFGQLEHKGSGSYDKPQLTSEEHEPYQEPRSNTSVSHKQHRAALIDKDTELNTSRHYVRSDSSREQRSSSEVNNRQLASVTHQHPSKNSQQVEHSVAVNNRHQASGPHQHPSKSSQQVEHSAASGTRYDNDRKIHRSQWGGEGGGTPSLRGREHGLPRRGKFGGGVNARGTEFESNKMHPAKQPLVVGGIGVTSQAEVRHEIAS
ncbi:hypothetical protein O6H91_02G076900 [Diphasiastrum complanatum]|uniref:Uncharacterized protein n=2 Tax=Diphasiastrum complanatum TaxID=34168 RepID=A0ACC2EHD0_DIPCM|nr:hypothetical protein O6H91_02G076900 [Diphasiastrum complanatum]